MGLAGQVGVHLQGLSSLCSWGAFAAGSYRPPLANTIPGHALEAKRGRETLPLHLCNTWPK